LERKVGITRVRGQAFYLKEFVLFPLLHPAAALHQGSMLQPLREDFQKLKGFLDRHSQAAQAKEQDAASATRTLDIERPSSPAQQMDLFGS
jgi:DNA polymerase